MGEGGGRRASEQGAGAVVDARLVFPTGTVGEVDVRVRQAHDAVEERFAGIGSLVDGQDLLAELLRDALEFRLELFRLEGRHLLRRRGRDGELVRPKHNLELAREARVLGAARVRARGIAVQDPAALGRRAEAARRDERRRVLEEAPRRRRDGLGARDADEVRGRGGDLRDARLEDAFRREALVVPARDRARRDRVSTSPAALN